MNKFEKRLGEIEKKMNNKTAPVRFAMIYTDGPDAKHKEQEAIDDYLYKYGCLDGLKIMHTHMPGPDPLPEKFKKIVCPKGSSLKK